MSARAGSSNPLSLLLRSVRRGNNRTMTSAVPIIETQTKTLDHSANCAHRSNAASHAVCTGVKGGCAGLVTSFAVRVQGERDQRGPAVSGALVPRKVDAGQAQRKRPCLAFGRKNPRREAREALLLIHAWGQLDPVEIHGATASGAFE